MMKKQKYTTLNYKLTYKVVSTLTYITISCVISNSEDTAILHFINNIIIVCPMQRTKKIF